MPETLEKQKSKIIVEDANKLDEKIPRNLIMMYDQKPYITKPGLEWKANKLFGLAGFSLHVDLVEKDFTTRYYLAKSTLTVLANGATYENYGEAYAGNSNSMMLKNLLHLAVTRAECRVLRMATACGYASYEEIQTLPQTDSSMPSDDEKMTEDQLKTLRHLGVIEKKEKPNYSFGQARHMITDALTKGRK